MCVRKILLELFFIEIVQCVYFQTWNAIALSFHVESYKRIVGYFVNRFFVFDIKREFLCLVLKLIKSF